MDIDISYYQISDGVWVAQPRGSIDSANAEEFGRRIHKLLEQETRHLLLDMAGVGYISSVGLGKLIELMKMLHQRGSSFSIYDTQLPVKRVLQISKLDFIELSPATLPPEHPFSHYIQSEEPRRAEVRLKKQKEKEKAEQDRLKEKSKKK